DVLLGEFGVPLKALLNRPGGVDKLWVPVETGDVDDASGGATDAAVQISVKVKKGFEFGEIGEAGRAAGTLWCRLGVHVDWVRLSIEEDIVGRFLGSIDEAKKESVYVRWRHPVAGVEEEAVHGEWEASQPVDFDRVKRNGLKHADLRYSKAVDVEMTPAVVQWFRDRKFEVEVLQRGEGQDTDIPLGTAYLDLWDLVGKVRKMWRKGEKRNESSLSKELDVDDLVVEGSFPLINPKSDDLKGARITLKVEMLPVHAPRAQVTSPVRRHRTTSEVEFTEASSQRPQSPTKAALSPSPSRLSPPGMHRIPIHITVERALHLPLMPDPFASTIPSPFVAQDELQLAPPNAFVTFQWQETETDAPHTVRGHVVPAHSCPTWNFQACVYQERSQSALRRLKMDKAILFKVWHAAGIKTGRVGAGEAEFVDEANSELLGTARVDLGSLFGGLRELYGWYHIVDEKGAPKGQLLLGVYPMENVGEVLKELSGKNGGMRDVGKVHNDKSSDAVTGKTEAGGKGGGLYQSRTTAAAAAPTTAPTPRKVVAAAISAAKEAKPGESIDTWVWTGERWEHRQVEVGTNEEGKPSTQADAGVGASSGASGRIHVDPGATSISATGTFTKRDGEASSHKEMELRSSLRCTMDELEELQRKLQAKSGALGTAGNREESGNSVPLTDSADAAPSPSIRTQPASPVSSCDLTPSPAPLLPQQGPPATPPAVSPRPPSPHASYTPRAVSPAAPLISPSPARPYTPARDLPATAIPVHRPASAPPAMVAKSPSLAERTTAPPRLKMESTVRGSSRDYFGSLYVPKTDAESRREEMRRIDQELEALGISTTGSSVHAGRSPTVPISEIEAGNKHLYFKPPLSKPFGVLKLDPGQKEQVTDVDEEIRIRLDDFGVDEEDIFTLREGARRSGFDVSSEVSISQSSEGEMEQGIRDGEMVLQECDEHDDNYANTDEEEEEHGENDESVDDDDDDDDSDEIYSILAYRRMAAAAAASALKRSPPRRRSSDTTTGFRPDAKPPLAPYSAPPLSPTSRYDPFGTAGSRRVRWKDDGRDPHRAGTREDQRGKSAVKELAREGAGMAPSRWRSVLEERVGEVSRERAGRIRRVFGGDEDD
ncbi:hypothetical protein HK104_003461, partial [Borealophlyctis nickersoniae]